MSFPQLPIVWWVVLPLLAVQWLLRRRRTGLFAWTFASWVSIWIFLRFGFTVPVPQSVVSLYMGIVTLACAAYVTSSPERRRSFTGPLVTLCVERRYQPWLVATLVGLPLLVAFGVYQRLNVALEAPAFGRTIHPAPPDMITVHEKSYDPARLDNPYRALATSDPAALRQHVANGRRVYYENCFYCHGDALRGDGMFAHGLNPIPANFADAGAIAMLEEAFLFWRIAKGGPGLPEESGPWDTAMPAWEKFLSEEEIWDVVLFLYDFTGQKPRAREAHE